MILNEIVTGKQMAPRRTLIYGVEGVGKSTWAANAPNPIFIQTEDGLADINCAKFPLAARFDGIIEALTELYQKKHSFQTVVLDSIDWTERLIWETICSKRNVKSIEDIGYSKGYQFALTYWRQLFEALSAVRNEKQMGIILIGHAKIEKFEDPEVESYDRYTLKLNKHASPIVTEWVDEVLFANYKILTKQTEEGFNKKRTQALPGGERILRTSSRPAHLAKNRLGLPEEIPLIWAEYQKHFTKKVSKKGK